MTTHNEHQIMFEQIGLGGILKRNHLKVPPNQRNYTWDGREVKQLFQDLARAIDEGDYFLGTIVTIPRENGVLELIDGQQRLATIAILLAAIRDYVKYKESVLAESVNNEFLTGIDRNKRQRIPKLILNLDDNELFACLLTGEGNLEKITNPTRESHQLLLQAHNLASEHIKNIISTFDEKDHGDVLNRWISYLEHRALVVLMRVPTNSDAFRMFETLNDRGIRTNQADLVKNYLFGRAGERFNEVQSRWLYMHGALESLSEEDITIDFLRYVLIVLQGDITEANVYERVQGRVKSEQTALEFATQLENLSNIYVATLNPEHERWSNYPDDVNRAIRIFGTFDIKPMKPIILAVAAKMDAKETAKSFNFLVSLGVRLLIASTTRSGSITTPLANIASHVYNGSLKNTVSLKKALEPITPSDAEFKEAFSTTKVSSEKFARYYLRALEMAAKGEKEPWYSPLEDKGIINLEHVLPKKPLDNWPNFNKEDVANCVQRLGNLALLQRSTNSDLKSADFKTKRKVYAESPYILTSQIAELNDWTPVAIGNRQKTIAALSTLTWPI